MVLLRWGHLALPPLMAMALAACGSPPPAGAGAQGPVAAPPATGGGNMAAGAAAGVATQPGAARAPVQGAGDAQSQLGGALDRPWDVSTDPYARGGSADATAPAGDGAPPAPTASVAPPAADPVAPPTTGGTPVIGGLPGAGLVPAAGTPIFGPLGLGGKVAFSSNRATGGGAGFDVFVYDIAGAAVLALPGVNSPADEINPRLSADGRWLVYATNQAGNYDIHLCDLASQVIDTLPALNSPFNEAAPTITDAGDTIAYRADRNGVWALGLYDLPTGLNVLPAPVLALARPISDPWISADGGAVAFSAPGAFGANDIFIYNTATAEVLCPPFLNSPAMDFDPAFGADGVTVVFASDRDGPSNIYLANLVTGMLDRLVLANSPASERQPRFLGPSNDFIVYVTDVGGTNRLQVFDLATGIVDLLPIAHEIGADDLLEDDAPVAGGSGIWGGFFGAGWFGGPGTGWGRLP